MAIASYLSANKPYLQDDSVFYKVSSNAIKHDLDQIKQELKIILSKGNKDAELSINFVVEESQEEQKRFFTSQEKVERLIEINPNIKKVIEDFKLQF